MIAVEQETNILRGVGARLAVESAVPLVSAQAEPTLTGVVLNAVRNQPASALSWFPRPDQGLAFQPKALLALLTYCYAKETYAARDIEDCMCRDANFRRLCENEFPGAHIIRQFRRCNREAITRCLAEVLRVLQGRRPAQAAATSAADTRFCARSIDPPGASEDTLTEARERVEMAVLMDHIMSEAD